MKCAYDEYAHFLFIKFGPAPENCKAIFGVGLSAPAATFYSLRPLLSLRHFLAEAFSLTIFLKGRNHSSTFTISSNPF